MQVKNNVEIPYKIDTVSEGNFMLLYIFKKLFKNIMVEQLKKSIKTTSSSAHNKSSQALYNYGHVPYSSNLKTSKNIVYFL